MFIIYQIINDSILKLMPENTFSFKTRRGALIIVRYHPIYYESRPCFSRIKR